MTVLVVLTVLAVLENTLPSFRWSFKIQDKEATVTVLAVLAVMAVLVVTATPLKLNPPFSVILTKQYLRNSICPTRHKERDPPVLKILRRVKFGTGRKFGTDVAKRYGEGSEMLVFLDKRGRKRVQKVKNYGGSKTLRIRVPYYF